MAKYFLHVKLFSRGKGSRRVTRAAAYRAGERIRESYGQVAEEARERYEMAEDVVRRNPMEAVAAAFGFGLVMGLAFGLALRSR